MSWTGVRIVTVVSVFGLTWLAPPAVEAQRSGLFSAVNGASARLDSPAPASLDATTLRRRVVTIDLERLRRARAAASVLPRPPVRTSKLYPRVAAVVTRRPRRMPP